MTQLEIRSTVIVTGNCTLCQEEWRFSQKLTDTIDIDDRDPSTSPVECLCPGCGKPIAKISTNARPPA